MIDLLTDIAYVASRYLHIVATAFIVGGTLFYLWVVPFAIEELKEESQRIVFARGRLIFRWIVFISALLLLVSGAVMTARSIPVYQGKQLDVFRKMAKVIHPSDPPTQMLDHPTLFDRPTLWFVLHLIAAGLCLIIAVALVRGSRPPQTPLPWMRLNFILLMFTILLAVIGRNARQRLFESIHPYAAQSPSEIRE